MLSFVYCFLVHLNSMFFLRLSALSGCFLKHGIYAGKEKRYLGVAQVRW